MLPLVMIMPSDRSGGKDDIIETHIANIAVGDQDALASLYEETHAAVYGFALSILKNVQEAEDVLHDAYLQIWRAAGSYTPSGKPMAWIFTITRNLARMRLRNCARTVTMAPEDWQKLAAARPAVEPEDQLVLAALLERLSDEERQIVMLHTVAGLKHREIAALLDLGLPTVLSKYNRALKKLRNVLKEAD